MIQTQEKINSFRYRITKFDPQGWAEASSYLPIPFDLVTVKTDTDKKVAGWWNTNEWEGFRLNNKDTVLFWKRRLYEQIT